MKTLPLTLAMLFSFTASAASEGWLCKSVDGVGMSFKNGSWEKSVALESILFEVKRKPNNQGLQFPNWLMMDDAACRENPEVPWISCSTGFSLFVINPKTGDAMQANTGLWVLKERMKSKGLPTPPLGADVMVFRCQ